MAKGGGRRSSSTSGGGIGGSGIFGLVGGTVQCPSSDTSLYCQFMKFMSVIVNIIMLMAILYFAYTFLGPYISKAFKTTKKGIRA
jgi:hypothetical protein